MWTHTNTHYLLQESETDELLMGFSQRKMSLSHFTWFTVSLRRLSRIFELLHSEPCPSGWRPRQEVFSEGKSFSPQIYGVVKINIRFFIISAAVHLTHAFVRLQDLWLFFHVWWGRKTYKIEKINLWFVSELKKNDPEVCLFIAWYKIHEFVRI